MKRIKKTLKLDSKDFYQKHLEVINPFLPIKLTPKEIEVLSEFMNLEGDLKEDLFGTTARKVVKGNLKISAGGLGNYLKSLKEKGFIYKKYGALFISEVVLPDEFEQEYSFKISNYG